MHLRFGPPDRGSNFPNTWCRKYLEAKFLVDTERETTCKVCIKVIASAMATQRRDVIEERVKEGLEES